MQPSQAGAELCVKNQCPACQAPAQTLSALFTLARVVGTGGPLQGAVWQLCQQIHLEATEETRTAALPRQEGRWSCTQLQHTSIAALGASSYLTGPIGLLGTMKDAAAPGGWMLLG